LGSPLRPGYAMGGGKQKMLEETGEWKNKKRVVQRRILDIEKTRVNFLIGGKRVTTPSRHQWLRNIS